MLGLHRRFRQVVVAYEHLDGSQHDRQAFWHMTTHCGPSGKRVVVVCC